MNRERAQSAHRRVAAVDMRQQVDQRRIPTYRPRSSPANARALSKSGGLSLAVDGSSIELSSSVKKETGMVWNQFADLTIAASFLGPAVSFMDSQEDLHPNPPPHISSSPRELHAKLAALCQAIDSGEPLPAEPLEPTGEDDLTVSEAGAIDIEEEQPETIDQPTQPAVFGSSDRFFLDLWLERHGSTALEADPLNIELLCKLQSDEAAAAQQLFANQESGLSKQACLLPYLKAVGSSALSQLDVLISVLGTRYPLLRDIRRAFMPLISPECHHAPDISLSSDEQEDAAAKPKELHPYHIRPDQPLYIEQYHLKDAECQQLNADFHRTSALCDSLEASMLAEKKKAAERENKISQAQAAKDKMQRTLDSLQSQLNESIKECKQLAAQLQAEMQKKNNATTMSQTLQKEKLVMESAAKEAQGEIYQLDKQLKEVNIALESAKKQLNETKKERTELRKDLSNIHDSHKKTLLDLNVDKRRFSDNVMRAILQMATIAANRRLSPKEGLCFDSVQLVNDRLDDATMVKYFNGWIDHVNLEMETMQNTVVALSTDKTNLLAEKQRIIASNENAVAELHASYKQELSALQKSTNEVTSTLRFHLHVKEGLLTKEKELTADLQAKYSKALEMWQTHKDKLERKVQDWMEDHQLTLGRLEMLQEDYVQATINWRNKLGASESSAERNRQSAADMLEEVRAKLKDATATAELEKSSFELQLHAMEEKLLKSLSECDNLTASLQSANSQCRLFREYGDMQVEDFCAQLEALQAKMVTLQRRGRSPRNRRQLSGLSSRKLSTSNDGDSVGAISREPSQRARGPSRAASSSALIKSVSRAQFFQENVDDEGAQDEDDQLHELEEYPREESLDGSWDAPSMNDMGTQTDVPTDEGNGHVIAGPIGLDEEELAAVEKLAASANKRRPNAARRRDTFFDTNYEPVRLQPNKDEASWNALMERLAFEQDKLTHLKQLFKQSRAKTMAELHQFHGMFDSLKRELPKRLEIHLEKLSTKMLSEFTVGEIQRRTMVGGKSAPMLDTTVDANQPHSSPLPPLTSTISDSNLSTALSVAASAGTNQPFTDMDNRALMKMGRALTRRMSCFHPDALLDEAEELEGIIDSEGSVDEDEHDDWANDGASLLDGGSLGKRLKVKMEYSISKRDEARNKLRDSYSNRRNYSTATQTGEDFVAGTSLIPLSDSIDSGDTFSGDLHAVMLNRRGSMMRSSLLSVESTVPALVPPAPDNNNMIVSEAAGTAPEASTPGGGFANKLRNATMIGEMIHKFSPQQLSLPFIGYIRKHEKIYAREIGLMKVSLRECKVFYNKTLQMLNHLIAYNPPLRTKLTDIQTFIADHNWLFNAELFTRKVLSKQPMEDPVDVFAQCHILSSYQDALRQEIDILSDDKSEITPVTTVVIRALEDLIRSLQSRVHARGGYQAMIYGLHGSLESDADISSFDPSTQLKIVAEMLRYVKLGHSRVEDKLLADMEIVQKQMVICQTENATLRQQLDDARAAIQKFANTKNGTSSRHSSMENAHAPNIAAAIMAAVSAAREIRPQTRPLQASFNNTAAPVQVEPVEPLVHESVPTASVACNTDALHAHQVFHLPDKDLVMLSKHEVDTMEEIAKLSCACIESLQNDVANLQKHKSVPAHVKYPRRGSREETLDMNSLDSAMLLPAINETNEAVESKEWGDSEDDEVKEAGHFLEDYSQVSQGIIDDYVGSISSDKEGEKGEQPNLLASQEIWNTTVPNVPRRVTIDPANRPRSLSGYNHQGHSAFFLSNISKKQVSSALPMPTGAVKAAQGGSIVAKKKPSSASSAGRPPINTAMAAAAASAAATVEYIGIVSKPLLHSNSGQLLPISHSGTLKAVRPHTAHASSTNKAPIPAYKKIEQIHRREYATQVKQSQTGAAAGQPVGESILLNSLPTLELSPNKQRSRSMLLEGSHTESTGAVPDFVMNDSYISFEEGSRFITDDTPHGSTSPTPRSAVITREAFVKLAGLLHHDIPNESTSQVDPPAEDDGYAALPADVIHTPHIPGPAEAERRDFLPTRSKTNAMYQGMLAKMWEGSTVSAKNEVKQYAELIYGKLQQHEEARQKMQHVLDKLQRTHNFTLHDAHQHS